MRESGPAGDSHVPRAPETARGLSAFGGRFFCGKPEKSSNPGTG